MLISVVFLLFLTVFQLLCIAHSSHHKKCVFVILSQSNSYHNSIAEKLKLKILKQLKSTNIESQVFISPKDFNGISGDWIILPIMEKLAKLKPFDWTFFLEDRTNLNVEALVDHLYRFVNVTQAHFGGHALYDDEPTIIHHYDSTVIPYPHFSAGFYVTYPLLMRAVVEWGKNKNINFSIDAKYELAKFFYEKLNRVKLRHEKEFCVHKNLKQCLTCIGDETQFCNLAVSKDRILFAVKTCEKFNKRAQVVKSTWAKNVKHIRYFSDTNDSTIPTMKLPVENVNSGHCQKTLLILQDVALNWNNFDWLVIADDDTLFSISRLLKKLSCYSSSDKIALGERYGYSVTSSHGYDYITGGGGMVFSMPTVKELADQCMCPAINSPDDMILGICLKNSGIPVIHSSLFHQARPNDYSPYYVEYPKPISFHKHWMVDPYDVYNTWLVDDKTVYYRESQHSEL